MKKRRLELIVHNVRSAHNVGSILRTADGFGVDKVYLTGYTPYPTTGNDQRLPHHRDKTTGMINKTALGAEKSLSWQHLKDPLPLIKGLAENNLIIALEQIERASAINDFKTDEDVVLIVGNEIGGLEPEVLELAATHLQIPMLGKKESYNVSVAAAIALYHLKFIA
jgi:23S rRNA (guanosine2251-2'-O)-methyltransferase